MLKYIFIGLIILLTLWTVYIYYENDNQHNIEMDRIRRIEDRVKKVNKSVNYYRMNTKECLIPGLINPRQCYLESNKTCTWHVGAKRCNQID